MPPITKTIFLLLCITLSSLNLQSQSQKKSRKAKKAVELRQRENIVATATRFIGTSYAYGGNKPSGFDCSGFVEFVYSRNNIEVPRVCKAQLKGAKKKRWSRLKPGDLVFFGKMKVKHVGIVLLSNADELVIVHASSSNGVAITDVLDSSYWKKRLKSGGTYIN